MLYNISMKIGLLTGGGDCPGLNAVIRAVVKTALVKYGFEVIGFLDSFKGLVEDMPKELSLEDAVGLLPKGGTILGTSNRHNPFKYLTDKGTKDLSDRAVETLDRHKIAVLITVGGDGTQAIGLGFLEKGIKVIGIPKTIDNDLGGTNQTFGFDSALHVATDALDRLHSTAESHHRIMVLEVMGRNAGWIALEAGLAGGADLILIPEIPFTFENAAKVIKERERRGKRFSLVIVSEGAKLEDGKQVIMRKVKDPTEPVRLGGIGRVVADKLEEIVGLESRYTILGHLQRGGSPSPFDRLLATRFGYFAVKAAAEEHYGKMVALKGNKIELVELKEAVNNLRRVSLDSDYVLAAKAIGIGFGDE